jgi:hypothetical protein
MEKVIPILPCINVAEQLRFYNSIGFETVYTQPNTYAVIKYSSIVLHFWLNKKMVPDENASMIFIEVDNVETIYDDFINSLKENCQKIPRSGIPRISKIRFLKEDRRFTVADPSGNTLYIGTTNAADDNLFFRTLDDKEHSKKFAVLYDILYSKEDYIMAKKVFENIIALKDSLNEMDKGKLLLIELEINNGLKKTTDGIELKELMEKNEGNKEWKKMKNKYEEIKKSE